MTRQPSAIGVVVPLNCRPIIVPSSAPPTVWMKPKTEAAVLATAPSGSMDSEFVGRRPAEDELHDHQQAEEQPERHEARQAEGDEEDAAADIDDQREMAQPAHAEALDDARIEERRDSHHSRHGREGDGEERASLKMSTKICWLEDTKPNMAPNRNMPARPWNSASRFVKTMPKPPVTDLNVSSRRYSGWSVSQAEEGPEADHVARPAMNTKIDCHGPVSSSTWPTPGAMMGMAMKTMKISDMTFGHVAAREAVADDGGRDHAGCCRGAEALRQAESEEDCEIRREGRGEGADDIDAQPEQQRDAGGRSGRPAARRRAARGRSRACRRRPPAAARFRVRCQGLRPYRAGRVSMTSMASVERHQGCGKSNELTGTSPGPVSSGRH